MPRDTRSRSPRDPPHHHHSSHRHRSRSPRRHHHSSHSARSSRPSKEDTETLVPQVARPRTLPCRAQPLSKRDLQSYINLFASYLDIQKQKTFSDLPESEVKGRWKSFIGKWNRGELAEGWYDPATKSKADDAASAADDWLDENIGAVAIADGDNAARSAANQAGAAANESEDEYGPAPAPRGLAGPRAATFADLGERDEQASTSADAARADLRHQRKLDRSEQRERLDDIAPRAAAGTRERQLEKRQDTAAAHRAFRDAGEAGMAEVGEREMLGSGGADEFKQRQQQEQRRKSERELRKEEQLRARALEREERLAGMREKEAKTMDMLKQLARERFSGAD